MSSIAAVLARISTEVAALERVQYPATTDLGFGSDLACAGDITEAALELSGDNVRLVTEAAYRRLTTPRGTLDDDPDYGLDARAFLAVPLTVANRRDITSQVSAELLRDDRIESVEVALVQPALNTLEVSVAGVTAAGSFAFTLALTDAGALLKEFASGLD